MAHFTPLGHGACSAGFGPLVVDGLGDGLLVVCGLALLPVPQAGHDGGRR